MLWRWSSDGGTISTRQSLYVIYVEFMTVCQTVRLYNAQAGMALCAIPACCSFLPSKVVLAYIKQLTSLPRCSIGLSNWQPGTPTTASEHWPMSNRIDVV